MSNSDQTEDARRYDIYVQQKIDRGLDAAERDDFISDEEIERRIALFETLRL